MWDRLKRLFYRDRRRLALSVALVLLASAIGFDYLPDPVPHVPSESLAAGALILAMPLVSAFVPDHRYLIELGAVSNLLFVLMGRVFPLSNFNLASEQVDFLSSAVLYGLTVTAVQVLVRGRWSDRFGPRTPVRLTARATTPVGRRALWFGLVPTPGHLEDNPDPSVVAIDYLDANRRIVRMIHWMPPHRRGETLLHIEEAAFYDHVRLRIESRGDGVAQVSRGSTSLRFFDKGTHRLVILAQDTEQVALRHLVRGWLDDTLGRMLDARLARIEEQLCTARQTGRQPKGRVRRDDPETQDFLDCFCSAEPVPVAADRHELRRRTDLTHIATRKSGAEPG